MSYTELEHGYQGLRKAAAGPIAHFYVPDDIITGELELCGDDEGNQGNSSLADSDLMSHVSDGSNENGGGTPCSKQVVVGVCAMAKKSQSKPMKEILTRLQEFEYIKMIVFPEEVILKMPVEEWPACDCLISFHSKGFPLDKAIAYAAMHKPYLINNLHMQYDIQDRRRVYSILEEEGIEIPRYAVLDRDSPDPKHHELVESEDHVEVNGVIFNKPFVEKPVSAEDHNIYIYYPTSAGGGSQRLFRKIGSRSSVYSPESRVRKTGSFIYEDFMPTDGTDVKVYTVGPDYAHAEARKSPALDGKVERDSEGKEIRYPVILSNAEKLISRKVCLAFKQAVCGFDLLRANGKSFVCDVNGFSFVKNSNKYYDDCAKILGNMILRELAPTLHIPWSVPFQLDDPPIVPTTFGKMMELRCVVAVIRHGDRTPKQKMKVEVRHPKFFEIFEKYDGYKHGHVKLKRPKQLQEILDIARSLLADIAQREAQPEIEEKQGKLEQLKSVLEMYGHFSGINRKVQMKYQPRGRPRGSSSDDGKPQSSTENTKPAEPSLVLILKWGGELTPAGRIQAEELGRIFRCMYPGGQGRHLSGEYAGTQGLGLLRLHSTFRHDLKIYASDEGRVQMTAAAFAKGLLALEGELTPILVQMVKSANTNGLLDNDCDSSKYQNMCKARLHELMQLDREFTDEERKIINPGNAESIAAALEIVKNPARCCQHVHSLIHSLMDIVRTKRDDPKTKDAILYHGETWELMGRRWGKIEKDFCNKNKKFDISKIPDIYDCIKYDLQHNQHTLQFEQAEELYMYAKYLADIVIPQEYGLTQQEKLTIGQGICTPLLKKIRADLQRNIEEFGEEEETVNRLNPRYSHGVSSPGRHVRTRLYFTSESHVHSLLTVLRYGGLLDVIKDEQWRRAMQYISMVSELNYMAQLVVMLYEDPTKDPSSEERFHVELHFSPGVNCCVQKNLPPGPGFRPHSRSESATANSSGKNSNGESTAISTPRTEDCSTRIDEEVELSADVTPTELSRRSSNTLTQTESTETRDNVDDVTTRLAKKKSSDPIPIGNSHTVSGHEAAHLAKRLTAELAQQQGRSLTTYENSRTVSPDSEPRARSFDQQRGDVNQNNETGASTGTTAINVRRHRHGIAGQMSYFKMLGFGFGGGPLGFKKIGAGSTNSLFSTAVISGSSSAPNLRDMIPNTASASTVEGFGGVPPIRPLETLHNALSLRQLDEFLERMTCPSTMMRTPASSPPKSCPLPAIPSSSINDSSLVPSVQDGILSSSNQPNAQQSHNVTSAQSLRLQSPSNSIGWSGPPSFVSSSGPSSPTGLSDVYSRESSDMSASLISSDGYPMGNNNGTISQLFPTAPGLDDDLGNVGLLLETGLGYTEFESISQQGDNGDITPVSAESEFDFNTADATAGSTVDADLTVTEDILDESSAQLPKESSDNSLIGGNNGNNNSTNNLCSSLINPCTTSTHIIQNDLDHHRSINLLEINNPIPSTSSLKKTNNTASVSSSSAESLYKTNNQTKKTELHRAFSFNGPRNNTYTFCSNNLTDLPPPQPKPSISPSLLERSNSLLTTKCNNNVGRNYYRRQNSTPSNLDSPQNLDKNVFNKNCSDKWAITKERFLVSNVVDEESSPKFDTEIVKGVKLCNFNKINNPGAVLVKEAFIEPLKLNRIQSKSFHGKTTESSSSNESTSSSSSANLRRSSEAIDSKPNYRKYHTQKSLPGMSSNKNHSLLSESIKKINESVPKPRFTTTIVDEGYATNNFLYPSEIKENIDRSTNSSIENHADIFATNQSVERDTLASVQKQSSGATSNNSIPTNDSNVHKPAPVLVLASSLTDKSHIVHGFNIKSNNDSDSLSDQ